MSDSNTLLKPSIPPDIQEVFDAALDDKSYKVWTGTVCLNPPQPDSAFADRSLQTNPEDI
jgi:hypothetical protein